MTAALGDLTTGRAGRAAVTDQFGQEFPEPALSGAMVQRLREAALTRVANENPALGRPRAGRRSALATGTRYREAIAGLEQTFTDGPPMGPDGSSLIELMRTPARQAPTSLAGQLRYIRSAWASILGSFLDEILRRLDLAIGVLAEDERALHLRFGGGTGGPGGDVERPSFATAADEPEAFSTDSAWMPRVVLIAKSTYVWLDQLSRTHGRDIRTLDAIPDEELDTPRAGASPACG
jgi:hypothetical protein